jgi:energy-coupling factor transport system ATP-binding protein
LLGTSIFILYLEGKRDGQGINITMENIIEVKDLSYTYNPGTPFEKKALDSINISIKKGDMVFIIGSTGSGKSTLIQHFNGLLLPNAGTVRIKDRLLTNKGGYGKESPLCFTVGLAFQYPEYQLFEETIYDDVAFGPRNMGIGEDEVEARVRENLEWVGIDYDKMKDRSPFSISGGEMRRVALAGVLAMNPEILVLDEPLAALDPRGRRELLARIRTLHEEKNITMIMVSHEMGDTATIANHIIVMDKGRIVADGAPALIFKQNKWIYEVGLEMPPYMDLLNRLFDRGLNVRRDVFSIDETVEEIKKLFRT